MKKVTYNTPIKSSLELLERRCLALHILINAQAPTTSHNVHNMKDTTRVDGNNVENNDRNKGDLSWINTKIWDKYLRKVHTCLKTPPEYGSMPFLKRKMPSCTKLPWHSEWTLQDIRSVGTAHTGGTKLGATIIDDYAAADAEDVWVYARWIAWLPPAREVWTWSPSAMRPLKLQQKPWVELESSAKFST